MEDSVTSTAFQGGRRDYFGKFQLLFKVMGMSLERHRSLVYKVYTFMVIFLPLFCYSLIRYLDLALMNDKPITYDRLLMPFVSILIFGKAIIFYRNRVKLAKILDKLEQEPFLPNPNRGREEEEESLQKNCMKIIKIQSIIYVGGTAVVEALISTKPLIKRILSADYHDWEFPFSEITILNLTHSPTYELWWFYETFVSHILGIQFAMIDAIVAAVLTYISFQFKILQNNIRRIVETSYIEMLKETGKYQNSGEASIVNPSMIPWKYLKKSLTQAIDHHLAILSMADETEDAINGLQLYLYLNTLGLLGVLISHPTPITRGGTFCCCAQLLASCFWGEQVMHESQEVGRAAFEANFVGADLRFQKSLAMIIRRSQNPAVITAGKFAVVCLSSLAWILRGGYSASTVLSHVQ